MLFTLLLSFTFTALFGQSPENLNSLALFSASAGFFTNAAVVGVYALCAQTFPTHARAFGTGFVIAVGRIGAVFSPIMAGYLFNNELSLPVISTVMGMGSLLAVISVFFRKRTAKN